MNEPRTPPPEPIDHTSPIRRRRVRVLRVLLVLIALVVAAFAAFHVTVACACGEPDDGAATSSAVTESSPTWMSIEEEVR